MSALHKLCQSTRRNITGDAFPGNCAWHQKPFVQAAYFAAACAAVLAPQSYTAALSAFRKIIGHDIERVEGTPHLSWSRYLTYLKDAGARIEDLKDVRDEVASVVWYPYVASKKCGTRCDILRYDRTKTTKEANIQAGNSIVDGKSTLDLLTLNKRWHKSSCRLPRELRPLLPQNSWSKLFQTHSISAQGQALTVVALNDACQLEVEGIRMSHCVGDGGYASNCMEGNTHILSIRDIDGLSLATIELQRSASGVIGTRKVGRWAHVQFRGPHNQPPSTVARAAFEQFLAECRDGKVNFNSEYRTEEKQRRSNKPRGIVDSIAGYDPARYAYYLNEILAFYDERVVASRTNGVRVPLVSHQYLEQKMTLDLGVIEKAFGAHEKPVKPRRHLPR